MRLVTMIFGLLLLAPGLSRGDTAPPPIMRECNSGCEKIDRVLRQLTRSGVLVKVEYRYAPGIEIAIPKALSLAAAQAGVMELEGQEVVFESNGPATPLGPVQMALAGTAASLAFVAAGIWLARRPERKRVAAVIILLVGSAVVASVVIYSLQASGAIPDQSASRETKAIVTLKMVENREPFQITIPRTFKPKWVGSSDVIKNWTEEFRSPRRSRFDKDKVD